MNELQVSDDVADVLTSEGLLRIGLSVSSRRLPCAICAAPLGALQCPMSVVVLRDPKLGRVAVRVAHAACARSEVRVEAIDVDGVLTGPPGHEWNLIRRAHAEVRSVLAWESQPAFDRPSGARSQPCGTDLIARGLRRAGFARASGSISQLTATSACGMSLSRVGDHLVLARDRRRWLEFSDAGADEGAEAWPAEASHAGRALLLYGPGLGGDTLAADSLARVLESGTALCAMVRVQGPRRTGRCAARSLASALAAATRPRSRGAHKLA